MNNSIKTKDTWRIMKKPVISPRDILISRLISILLALAIAGIGIALLGESPIFMVQKALDATIGSWRGIEQVLIYWIPVALLGLAVIVAMRAGAWNVGVQGQYLVGALAAAAVGQIANIPSSVSFLLMFLAGAAAGVIWILIPTLAKVFTGVNELVTTFLLNFAANYFVMHFLTGPLRDTRLPLQIATPKIAHTLPKLLGTQIHVGIILPFLLALGMTYVFKHLKWGYEVTIVGSSMRTAEYIGLPVKKQILTSMLISGAIAGIVGMVGLAGVTVRMTAGTLSTSYGYEGLLIAALADFSPLAILPATFLYSILLNSGIALQTHGLTIHLVDAITGLVLLFSTVGATLTGYRLTKLTGIPCQEESVMATPKPIQDLIEEANPSTDQISKTLNKGESVTTPEIQEGE